MKFLEFRTILRLDENQAQYKQMLEPMVNNDIIDAGRADSVVRNLRNTLKRQDRIVWYLRWFRISETHKKVSAILANPKFESRTAELKQLFRRITKVDYDETRTADVSYFSLRWQNPDALEHLTYSLSIPLLDQLTWDANMLPRQMTDKLKSLEAEHNAKQKQWVNPKENDKIILKYGKYAWVMLARGACSDEADAMGHCGNVPSEKAGDRILSFRTIEGEKQKPHLTFILDKNGKLGEMKGRANEKPAAKYHPYIVDLLLQDFITGIKGGGYEAHKNFDLLDLSDEEVSDLIAKKPSFMPKLDLKDPTRHPVPYDLQHKLIKRNPKWTLKITNLLPEYKDLRRKFAYAVVTEPGLTDLTHNQYLSKDEYDRAVDAFYDDAFSVDFF